MTKTIRKAALYIAALAVLLAAVLVAVPWQAGAEAVGAFQVTGGTLGEDYEFNETSKVLTILKKTPLTISNTDNSTPTDNTIVVAAGTDADITLDGVNIDVSSKISACAFKIEDDSTGNVTITLEGENVLKSGSVCAGLQKNGTGENIGTLTIEGTGSLEAVSGECGAGIGGGNSGSSSNITVSGGTVIAAGSDSGAGIGGGNGGSGSNITVSGGTVTAKGGNSPGGSGAGIGGGAYGNGSDIIISGGSVKAVAGAGGNDIGGGNNRAAVTPTSDGSTPVYLFTIANENGEAVRIDDADFEPANHNAADSTDNNLYLYLTGEKHTINVGEAEIECYFDADRKEFYSLGANFTITGDDLVYGEDYTYPSNTGVLTVLSGKKMTIANADPNTAATDTIVVAKNVSADITLDGVNIDVSATPDVCAFKIEDDSEEDVTITLADGSTNVLKSGKKCAGLQKNGTGENIGKLTINGTGSLEAVGVYEGAGIGGGTKGSSSNIEISGGTVTAEGYDAAGIGGGYNGIGSNITISGGTVIATGGSSSAGIGGSSMSDGSNITISGGTVTAKGGSSGAGIGGGYMGNGSDIEISGGTVIAKGGYYGAGIGGGDTNQESADIGGKNIKISGGTVTAEGGYYGAGIGGGDTNQESADIGGKNIKISGGTVTAEGGYNAAGIGGGAGMNGGTCENVIISGGSVKAVAGEGGNDIGGGHYRVAVIPTSDGSTPVYPLTIANANGEAVKIDGADADFEPANHNAADSADNNLYLYLTGEKHTVTVGNTEIECYFDADKNELWTMGTNFIVEGGTPGTDYIYRDGVLTVKTGTALTVKNADGVATTTDTIAVAKNASVNITLAGVNIDVSKVDGACAFFIEDESTGNVNITLADGSTNVLKSGEKRAGIHKNGSNEGIGTLTIGGTGSLEAVGGYRGAGIGGGYNGAGSNITISGGKVTATGGDGGAGIGGGYYGAGSNITISGGVVTAAGGYDAAGIGGGENGAGTDITISGGIVTANGGYEGAGIGGGYYGIGSNIKISNSIVTAKGGAGGAGIGGGYNNSGSGIIISGGSVKAVAGANADAVGGGRYRIGAFPPTDGNGENVYPIVIANPDGKEVLINGKSYTPVNHKAADPNDGNLYAYVPLAGADLIVTVGDTEIKYYFDHDAKLFWTMGSDFVVTNGIPNEDYIYPANTGVLTVKTSKEITIANANGVAAATDTIAVAKDVAANITLDGVNIDVSEIENACAFKIEDNSTENVTITLKEGSTNVLKSGKNCAGLQKNGNDHDAGKLTIKGAGSLEAVGGENGAGIGGGYNGSGTNITVSDSTVTATGGYGGAGIGGGSDGSSSNITISGSTVTAEGGNCAADIGGGYRGSGLNITISGGSVKAGAGGNYGAIGGGDGQAAVTPTNSDDKEVYPLVIANPDGKEVLIDGNAYTPVNHNAADPEDGNLYAYVVKKESYTVTVGGVDSTYYFDSEKNMFWTMGTELTVTGGAHLTDYIYRDGVLTVKTATALTIENTDKTKTTMDTIVVAKNVSANITLNGVNIDAEFDNTCAFLIENGSTGNVTITLAEGSLNVLESGYNCAGIQKNGSGENIGKLTIEGTGSLEVSGGYRGAGIGSSSSSIASNITISGGTVTANGGFEGAGIGGGWAGNGEKITVTGGVITANGGNYGAGIGGGYYGDGTNITISGGTVTAIGNNCGAGIGGSNNGIGENIIISGGSVKAVAGQDASAIGGSTYSSGAVTPTDGSGNNVYLLTIANPNSEAVKITHADGETVIDGTGSTPVNHKAADPADGNLYVYVKGEDCSVTVGNTTTDYFFDSEKNDFWTMGTEFTVTGGKHLTDYIYRDGVLTVKTDAALTIANTDKTKATTDTIVVAAGTDANITLNGINIDVSATTDACAFKIADDSANSVTITLAEGSLNVLRSGENCAGIQKNSTGSSLGKLTINGAGSLEAYGGYEAAGIGGGFNGGGSNIKISGGTVTANGGDYGAGIGGGYNGDGSNIKISGGTVTANGGDYGAGIGGGSNGGIGSDITISGGTVTATGGNYGAGIGGGAGGSGSNIAITGGSVKAVAGRNANAIGGSEYSSGAVTPTDSSGNNVYLLTIANPNSEAVKITHADGETVIDGTGSTPVNHKAADPADGNLYVYVKGEDCSVTVGNTTTDYFFDSEKNEFWIMGTEFTVTGGKHLTDYIYRDGVLTVKTDAALTIANTDKTKATTDTIVVAAGVNANITLNGVNIDAQKANESAFLIEDDSTGNVTITLAEGSLNVLKSGANCAGIQKTGTGDNIGKLTINGTGSLEAVGGYGGAGIGGAGGCSNVEISGGTVTITGISGGISDFIIIGGSVKGVFGITPTDGKGNNVYLLTIANPNGETVEIDGNEYTPANHSAADPSDTNLYVYLPDGTHFVTIGDETTHYHLNASTANFFEGIPSGKFTSDGVKHWHKCSVSGCDVIFGEEEHYGGEATCSHLAICEKCGEEYGELDPDNHEEITTELSYDVVSHWHYCTGCSKRFDEAAHFGGTATCSHLAICEVCGIEYGDYNFDNHEEISTEWNYDSVSHWHYCTGCSKRFDEAAHFGGTATCSTGAICEECGEEYGDYNFDNHEAISTELSYDGVSHWYECTNCHGRVDEENHYGGTATCSTRAICEECGVEYGGYYPDNHYEISDKWSHDGESHWHECIGCYGRVDEENHYGGTATCSTGAICEECGEEYGELDPDNHEEISDEWKYDDDTHWHECTGCHEKFDEAAHSGKATCSSLAKCKECGVVHGNPDPDNHINISTTWNYDEYSHWVECTGCHEKFDIKAHFGGEATCNTLAICAACGKGYGELDPHNHTDVSPRWDCDGESHWHECRNCGGKVDEAAHDGSPDCVMPGICSVCGDRYSDVDPTKHDPSNIRYIPYKSANCTEDGHEGYYMCACGKLFTAEDITKETTLEEVTIKAYGHHWSSYYNFSTSEHWHICVVCDEISDVGPHKSSGAATETTPEICTVCGYVIAPELGHVHTNHLAAVPAKAATCTEDGYTAHFRCSCGKLFSDETAATEVTLADVTIKAADHKWSENYKFDEHGHWHYCTVCGEAGAAEAHKSSGAATETTPETCTVCGYVITPELGHSHTDYLTEVPAKAVTCTEDGNIAYFKCACGKLFTDSTATTETTLEAVTIKAEGHKFGRWITTKPATRTSTGIKTRTCTVCGETEEAVIPKRTSGGGGGYYFEPMPKINGEEKSWDDIISEIKKLPEGRTLVIDMNGTTSVPVDAVKAISSSKIRVEFIIDSTKSYVTDGTKITNVSGADFTILAGVADRSGLRGVFGADIKIGGVGIPADMKLKLNKDAVGKFANIYRLTDGRLTFIDCAKVDESSIATISGMDIKGEYVVMVCEFSDVRGDVNNDGVLNALDAASILRSVIGLEECKNPLMADFNSDGAVNALDAAAILKRIIGVA